VAERVAADKRKDDALRLKLDSVAGKCCCHSVSPLILICTADIRTRPPSQAAQGKISGVARRLAADQCTMRDAKIKA
jgi:hypothetical protein